MSERMRLADELESQAAQIANAGHNGWGNTMLFAASQLRADEAELARKDAEIAGLQKRYADSESKLAFCDAALQELQAELARLRMQPESRAADDQEPGGAGNGGRSA